MTNPRSTAVLSLPLILLATVVLGACSSSKSSSKGSATTAAPPASSPAASSSDTAGGGGSGSGSPADISAITSVYTKFFDSKIAPTGKSAMLQNGDAFKQVIIDQAKSPLTAGSSVTVSKVNVLSGGKATVTFTININGAPTLANQGGWAVKEGGTWKVAGTTFCGLVSMAGTTPSVCMDAKSTTLPG